MSRRRIFTSQQSYDSLVSSLDERNATIPLLQSSTAASTVSSDTPYLTSGSLLSSLSSSLSSLTSSILPSTLGVTSSSIYDSKPGEVVVNLPISINSPGSGTSNTSYNVNYQSSIPTQYESTSLSKPLSSVLNTSPTINRTPTATGAAAPTSNTNVNSVNVFTTQSLFGRRAEPLSQWLKRRNLDVVVQRKSTLIFANALLGLFLLIVVFQYGWDGEKYHDDDHPGSPPIMLTMKFALLFNSVLLCYQILDRHQLQLSIKYREQRRRTKSFHSDIHPSLAFTALLSLRPAVFRGRLWIQLFVCFLHPFPFASIFFPHLFPNVLFLLMFLRLHLFFRVVRDSSDIWINRRSIRRISVFASHAPNFDWWLSVKTLCYRFPMQFAVSLYSLSVLLIGYAVYILEREANPTDFTFAIGLYIAFQSITVDWAADVYDIYNPVTWPGKFISLAGSMIGLLLMSLLVGIISQSMWPSRFEEDALNWISVEKVRTKERDEAARLIQLVWRGYRREKELSEKLEAKNPRLYQEIIAEEDKHFMEDFMTLTKNLRQIRSERAELEEQMVVKRERERQERELERGERELRDREGRERDYELRNEMKRGMEDIAQLMRSILKEKERRRGRRDRERMKRKKANEAAQADGISTGNKTAEQIHGQTYPLGNMTFDAGSQPLTTPSGTKSQPQSAIPRVGSRARIREKKPRRVKRGESLEDEIGEFGRRGRRASINYSEINDFEKLAEGEAYDESDEDSKQEDSSQKDYVNVNQSNANLVSEPSARPEPLNVSPSLHHKERPPFPFAHSMPPPAYLSPNIHPLSDSTHHPNTTRDVRSSHDEPSDGQHSPIRLHHVSDTFAQPISNRNRIPFSSRTPPSHHSDREHDRVQRTYSKTLSPRSAALAQRAIDAMTGSRRARPSRSTRLGLATSGNNSVEPTAAEIFGRSRSGSGYLFHRGSVPAFLPSDEETIHAIANRPTLQSIFQNPENDNDNANANVATHAHSVSNSTASTAHRPLLARRDSWA